MKPLIIAKPVGGLANQLHVYAASLALSQIHGGVPIKFDLSSFPLDPQYEYELDKLDIQVEFADDEQIRSVIGGKTELRWRRRLEKWFGLKHPRLYKEKQLTFNPDFFKLPNRIYLDGNFPSLKYVLPVMSQLRTAAVVTHALSDQTQEWERRVLDHNAVSLHVRRGDYVRNPRTQQYHGNLGASYYQSAVRQLMDHTRDFTIFVFSDDIAWVRENIQTDGEMLHVDCNSPENGFQDFHLMKQCHHHIIANSGFSRWPALLNDRPDRLVFMPEQWISGPGFKDDDIAPTDWIRIPN